MMYCPRSSNSLLVMMRLLTLATISSTIAAPASRVGARSATRSRATRGRRRAGRRARAGRGAVLVFAHVVERHDRSIDTDIRLFFQVGDEAVERFLSPFFGQVELHAPAGPSGGGALPAFLSPH